MSLSQSFFKPFYEDAPWLSDQLLLPNLARGHSIHVLSAFAPSYLFKLVDDLAGTQEVEPGFLNIVFFVPGDLSIRSQSIARFKKYLLTHSDDWNVAKFVTNALQLIKEARDNEQGGLQITVQHTTQKKPLTKSLAGVIVDLEDPDSYVSFVDAKGGDFNSPVQINRSWFDDEEFAAQEVLGLVASAVNNQNPRASLVIPTEVEEWLIYLANFYEDNPPVDPETLIRADEDQVAEDEDEDDNPLNDEFLEHLLNLEEFEDEDQYGWYGSDSDEFDLGPVSVDVSSDKALHGHIPPLEPVAAYFVGQDAIARCVCGSKFIRANGCDEIVWDRWALEEKEENFY